MNSIYTRIKLYSKTIKKKNVKLQILIKFITKLTAMKRT